MPAPYRVFAFSGSLRHGSTNTGLVRLATRLATDDLQIEWIDWIDQLPWMNPDLEAAPPEVLERWWATLRAADALIVGMPEYNWSPTPLAKNALDWATRPPDDRAIKDTVVAFLGSGGRGGTAKAQENLGVILGYMGATMVIDPPVQLAMVTDRFDADGNTDDPEIIAAVKAKLDAVLVALAERDARHEAEANDA
ncbi:MAG: NADPH-dependent FMN reductase [Ilumatobacteraceae bacterium]